MMNCERSEMTNEATHDTNHDAQRESRRETHETQGDANCAPREASYLALYESGELTRRVESLERLLRACTVCPLDCGNDRTQGELARCYSGSLPIVSSYTAHFGEEPAITGTRGAGNIFFGNCDSRNKAFRYNTLQGYH
jgi:uncharacterized Fe-S radical SAM superfamily protein PflX